MGRIIHTKLRGVSRSNDDGTDRQAIIRKSCRAGDELRVYREPDNPVDPNAIAIFAYYKGVERQLGYLPSELAAELAPKLRRGKSLRVVVSEVTGGQPGYFFGVNVTVEVAESNRPDDLASAATNRPPIALRIWDHLHGLAVAGVRGSQWLKRVTVAAAIAVTSWYRRSPEWARPIVWGVGIALPVVATMLLVRTLTK
jgi:HIRAN domain